MNKMLTLKFITIGFGTMLSVVLFLFIFSPTVLATCGVSCDNCTKGSIRCSNGVEWTCNYQNSFCCIGCPPGPCVLISGPGCCWGGCLNGDTCWAISGTCCEYGGAPSCGTIVVKKSGGSDPITCISGNQSIDVYLFNVVDAERVQFPSWTDVNGQDDLVWYDAVDQGGGVWKKTINLTDHAGLGDFHIHAYAHNCDTENHFCSGVTITKAPVPDCPNYLYVNHQCGATTSKATFSWGDYYGSGGLVKPDTWVLRVNRDDIVPFYPDSGYDECTLVDGKCVAYEWMTDHDYWRYATSSPISPNDISSCAWDFGGEAPILNCSATLDSTTLSKGGYPFTAGHYNWWSVQAVDDCGNYSDQCSVQAPGFDCINQAPTCEILTAPDIILYGDSGTYTARISDPIDPINYTWTSLLYPPTPPYYGIHPGWGPNGFSVAFGTVGNPPTYADISTTYTPVDEIFYRGNNTQIKLSVTDTVLESVCPFGPILLRYPIIEGSFYDATDDDDCGTADPKELNYLAGDADISIMVSEYANSSVGIVNGTYKFDTTAYPVTSNLESLYLSDIEGDRDIVTPPDTTLKIKCVDTACTHDFDPDALPADCTVGSPILYPSLGSLLASGPYAIPGDVTINLGYKLVSTLNGWFTVLNGDVYDGSGFVMIVPQEPMSYGSYLTNSFALSSGPLIVRDSDTPQNERIIPDGSGSYGYGYAVNSINLAILPSDLPSKDDLTTITSLSSLDPSEVYYIEKDDLTDVLSVDVEDYSSEITSDGVVVIKTDDTIEFTHKFYSADRDKKILFVTTDTVTFEEDITAGMDIPNGDIIDDPRIDVGIFTMDDINFPSAGSEEGDLTLAINGLLISGDTINFNRDRKLQNSYPGVAVHFDPAYVYYLQKQMMDEDNPDYAEKIMTLVDISWDIEN